MKRCSDCRLHLGTASFHVRRKSPDGLALICKSCSAARGKIWYEQNKDRVKAAAKKWAAANPERRREVVRAWDARNAEKNAVKDAASQRARRWADIDAARDEGCRQAAVRRSRVLGNGGNISRKWWRALHELFEFKTCL